MKRTSLLFTLGCMLMAVCVTEVKSFDMKKLLPDFDALDVVFKNMADNRNHKWQEEKKADVEHKKSAQAKPVDEEDMLGITADIKGLNDALLTILKDLEPKIKGAKIPDIDLKGLKIIGTELNVTLTKGTITNIDFKGDKPFGLNPTGLYEFEFSTPEIEFEMGADFEIDIKLPLTKKWDTYKGTMTLAITDLVLDLTLDSESKTDVVSFKVKKKKVSFTKLDAEWSDPKFQKIWKDLFGLKTTQELLISLAVLPKIAKAIEGINLAKALDKTILGMLRITAGLTDKLSFPSDQVPMHPTRYLSTTMYLDFYTINKKTKVQTKNPGLLHPDFVGTPPNSFNIVTFAINHDLINNILWLLFESNLLDIELNEENAKKLLPIPLNTEGIKLLFPEIQTTYPGKQSVILKVGLPEWDKKKVSFRGVQGRYNILLTINMEVWVYLNKYNPDMDLDNCGKRCVKALNGQISLAITLSAGVVQTKQEGSNALNQKIALSFLGVDLGNSVFTEEKFPVDAAAFEEFIGGLLGGLLVSEIAPIDVTKYLKNFVLSLDIKKDQKTYLEFSLNKEE